jgi:two-component system cell cycle response regulator CtrA
MHVLRAEDDLILSRGISLMLKSTGVVVDQTNSGTEALELVKDYNYDIVILDLELPDVDGFEIVRRMRVSRIETPVLMLSCANR